MRSNLSAASVLLCLSVLLAAPVCGEDFRVEAAVDRDVVVVGRTLRLTITVYGASDVRRPDLSDLEGFQVVSTSSSQNVSLINTRLTRSLSLTYTLAALQEGQFVLGPFAVRAGDKIGETEPVMVRVTPAAAGVTAGEGRGETAGESAAFAVASVDKHRAYVGEQVTYTLRFAYRLRMLQGMEFIPPEHTGFWYEDLGDTGPDIEVIDSKQYYVVTKKLAFFPISSGSHTIGQSGIRYVAESRDAFGSDPFSLFGRDPFGRLRGEEGIAMADPVTIKVLPLPTVGRPADFSGAVGSFTVSARPTRNEVEVGESVTLVVKVSGSGNLKSVGDIPIPEIPGFRVFAPKSSQSVSAERGVVGGEKRFEFVLVAEEPGIFTIDGIGLAYFDTQSEKYATARARPVTVTVVPGDAATASGGAATGIDLARTDIRHIRRNAKLEDDLTLVRGSRALLLWAMPLAVAIAGVIVKAHRRRQASCVRVSARRAFQDLMKEVKRARAAVRKEGGREEAAAIISRAIAAYVAARANCSESSADLEYIASLSTVTEETRSRLLSLLAALHQVRFAPGGPGESDMEGLLAQAESIFGQVNREWKQ